MEVRNMPEYAALVAIDWADQQHAVCLSGPSTEAREQTIVKHTPAALQEWALGLRQRFAGAPIAVCLEQSRGPLIYGLLQYDFLDASGGGEFFNYLSPAGGALVYPACSPKLLCLLPCFRKADSY